MVCFVDKIWLVILDKFFIYILLGVGRGEGKIVFILLFGICCIVYYVGIIKVVIKIKEREI